MINVKNFFSTAFVIFLFFNNTTYGMDQSSMPAEYGSKTDNLRFLKEHIEKTEENILVPDFTAFSNNEIKTLLQTFKIDLNQYWTNEIANVDLENLFQGNQLSENFTSKLEDISKNIFDAFNENSNTNIALPEEVQTFINKASKENWNLMVRSTGMEDTDEVSNAGGNETVANVKPNKQDILKAMGIVVASYFSPKSFNQITIELFARGKTKEEIKNILLAQPFVPVLIQRMIGERQDAQEIDIPISCVVFTQEPLTGDQNVTTISATFGHGEGVVGGGNVSCDTYYVLNSEETFNVGDSPLIFKKVQKKKIRFRPQIDGELELVENPKNLINQPSLSDETILKINHIAKGVADTYEKPMDIELIYIPSSQTIYLVQARPIIQIQREHEPNYIKNINAFENKDIIKCKTLLDGQSFVRKIDNSNQIIIVERAEQALSQLNQNTKVVCVEHEAALLSHPMVILRSNGSPVLLLNRQDKNKLEQFISQENINLIIDPQRGIIINLLENEEPQIVSGYLNHPISLEASFFARNIEETFNIIESLKHLNKHITMKKIIEGLIKTVTEDEEETVKIKKQNILLETIIFRIQSELQELNQKIENYEDQDDWDIEVAKKQLSNLKILLVNAQTIYKYLQNTPMPNKTSSLLAIRLLETLLFQNPNTFLIQSISLKQLFSGAWNLGTKIAKYVFPLMGETESLNISIKNPRVIKLILWGINSSFNDNYTKNWILFIDKMFRTGNLDNFEELANNIKQLDIFPKWFSTSFQDTHNKENALEILNKEYESALVIINTINQLKENLDFFKKNMSEWENPNKFDELLKNFKEQVLEKVESEQFIQTINENKTNKMTMLVVTEFMAQLVEAFDQSIKTLKGSTLYENNQKVENFNKILFNYLILLEKWLTLLPNKKLEQLMPKEYHSNQDLRIAPKKWLKMLRSVLENNRSNTNQLSPSQDFNVLGAALGSTAFLSRHTPTTCEDVFTTIHQSLITNISTLLLSNLSNIKTTNIIFEKYDSALKEINIDIDDLNLKTSILSIGITNNSFIKTYNLPLRNHSCILKLELTEKKVILSMILVGQNENRRWNKIAFFHKLFEIYLNVKSEYLINNLGATYKLEFSFLTINEKQLENFIKNCIYITFWDITRENYIINFFENLSPTQHFKMNIFHRQKFKNDLLPEYLGFLKVLVEKGQAYEEATKAAHISISNDNYNIKISALELFQALFEKGQAYDEATKAAQEGISNDDDDIKILYLNLFKSLVEKERGYDEAIETAQISISNDNYGVQYSAINLFKALVEKKRGYEEAINAAQKGISNDDDDIKILYLNLFKSLVEKERGYEKAIETAQISISNDNYRVQKAAINLFKELFKKERGYEEAIETAQEGISNDSATIQKSAIYLFKSLVEKRQGYNQAINAALKVISNDSATIQYSVINLFKALVEKGQAYDEATKAAQEGFSNDDDWIQESAIDLFKALFEKEQGYDQAIETAKTGISNRNHGIRRSAIDLFKALFEKGRGYNQAIKAAQEGISNDDGRIQESAKNLLYLLRTKINNSMQEATEERKKKLQNLLIEIDSTRTSN